jgi:hypothetical protein
MATIAYAVIKLVFNVVSKFTKLFGTIRSIRKAEIQRNGVEMFCNSAKVAALYNVTDNPTIPAMIMVQEQMTTRCEIEHSIACKK